MNRKISNHAQECIKCEHFFITYEKDRPYGCRAYGFKSRLTPRIVVKEASGKNCILFKERLAGKSAKNKKRG